MIQNNTYNLKYTIYNFLSSFHLLYLIFDRLIIYLYIFFFILKIRIIDFKF